MILDTSVTMESNVELFLANNYQLELAKLVQHSSGDSFFSKITSELSTKFHFDYVFISVICNKENSAETLSISSHGTFQDNIKYKTTTNESNSFMTIKDRDSANKQIIHKDLSTNILKDKFGMYDYVDVPITDHNNELIGSLGFLHHKKIKRSSAMNNFLEYLALILSKEIIHKDSKDVLHLLETAFESQDSICITDAKGVLLKTNRAFHRITGFSKEDSIGNNISILKSGKHNKEFYTQMWTAIKEHGHWQGEIWNRRKNGELFPEWQIISGVKNKNNEFTHFVSSFVDLSKIKLAEETIKNLAFYNPITKLPNDVLFKDRLRQLIDNSKTGNKYGALILFTVNDFSNNDHNTSDNICPTIPNNVANYLRDNFSENDSLAQISNNKFAILMCHIANDSAHAYHNIRGISEKLLDGLGERLVALDPKTYITIHVGTTLITNDNCDSEIIFKQATTAHQRASSPLNNSIQQFQPPMMFDVARKLDIINSVTSSMANDEFDVYMQPQVDLHGNITGAEALLRWKHSQLGVISPAEFIPIIEETGQILDIGYWVLQESCKLIKKFELHGSGDAFKRIAVNISPVQLREPDFVSQIMHIVKESKINPSNLELEITEGVFIDHPEDAINKLNELRNFGIQFSIDDFGTGFSSLHYLKKLPIYKLKIDRSFVKDSGQNAKGKALLDSIQHLSTSMGFQTIAEGVENESEFSFLKEIKITLFQGFYFYKPMLIQEFEKLVISLHIQEPLVQCRSTG